jgi:hypothetical protein
MAAASPDEKSSDGLETQQRRTGYVEKQVALL